MQVVVVETGGRPVVVGGDVAVRFGELDEPNSEGQLRARWTPSWSGSRTSHGDPGLFKASRQRYLLGKREKGTLPIDNCSFRANKDSTE